MGMSWRMRSETCRKRRKKEGGRNFLHSNRKAKIEREDTKGEEEWRGAEGMTG